MSKTRNRYIVRRVREITEMVNQFVTMDKTQLIRLEEWLGSKLLSVYYEGYGDGLRKAKEIYSLNGKGERV